MKQFSISLLIFVLTSCATIPSQAPKLSEELGNKIALLEKSHLDLLHLYFDQKRLKVDEFITNTWIPEFTSTFFKNESIQDAWNHIVSSNNTTERFEFFNAVGPQLQSMIDEKRQELIKPLDDLEDEIAVKIKEEYELAKSANNTLTSFLHTASKIDANRQRYLAMAKIPENKISTVLDETDKILNDLVTKSDQVMSKEGEIEKYKAKATEYLEKLKELKSKL